jgi:hypothetical protein
MPSEIVGICYGGLLNRYLKSPLAEILEEAPCMSATNAFVNYPRLSIYINHTYYSELKEAKMGRAWSYANSSCDPELDTEEAVLELPSFPGTPSSVYL